MLIYSNHNNLYETQFWLWAVTRANKPTFHSFLYKVVVLGSQNKSEKLSRVFVGMENSKLKN